MIIVQKLRRRESSNLQELRNLAESADYIVVNSIEQTKENSSPYLIGKGKAEELANMVKALDIQKVIFENDLKPVQAYNLAKLTGVEAIDRFQLILEIFDKRANSQEAHLQIRLARLRYQLPRIKESIRLARLGEQPGFMGLGRYEVDVHLEDIKRQIAHIRRELREVRQERALHRRTRAKSGLPTVALAGYTNAGKTSLFNVLAKESKTVDNSLFTTLSPSTRLVLFAGRRALLTDTVGFIDRLPVLLVEAFHSTLEETACADAIILILDIHDTMSEIHRKYQASINTIQAIGAAAIPRIVALNKADLVSAEQLEQKLNTLGSLISNTVLISTVQNHNIDELKLKVSKALGKLLKATFTLPNLPESTTLVYELYNKADSVQCKQTQDIFNLSIIASPETMEMLRKKVEKLRGQMVNIMAVERVS